MRCPGLALAVLVAIAGCTTARDVAPVGLFRADDGSVVELHRSPDQQIRGYLREGPRVAALSNVRRSEAKVSASAVYDDGSRAEIEKRVRLIAAEKPASAAVRREIEDAYEQLGRAVSAKDFEAFQAIRVADFATIPPEGVPSPAARMAERARGLLDRIQPPIANSNDILELTTRGDEAIATVRQHFSRQLVTDGQPHSVYNEVTQRETWRKTADGWKLAFVDEVRAPLRVQDDPAGVAFIRKIRAEGIAAAIAEFDAQRSRDPNAVLFQESSLNAAGYSFLAEGRNADAIEVFKLNVRAYPKSANVYDSLAEAYLNTGDKAAAAQWYREALRRSPADDRIRSTLQKLGAPVSDDEIATMLRDWVPPDVELRPNVVYATHSRPLRMHVLLPRNAATNRPAIVFIHGGGWTEGSRERGLPSLIHFVKNGYVAASIEYRLSGEAIFPAQIDDVRAAIEYVREHASDFGVDPHRIAVWGQSAGGHLAALAGTSLTGPARPDIVIDWNGPTDFLEPKELARLEKRKIDEGQPTFAMERLLGGHVSERRDLATAANPITWVTPDDPPFLILHGSGDEEVSISQSEMLRDALAKAGVEVTLKVFPGEGHFGIGPLPFPDKYYAPMDEFLAKHFG